MSKRRSGLLAGLVVGFIATLVCGSGVGAAVLYMDRFPTALRTFGDGVPLLAALAFVAGVLIGWAIRLVRPRSILLSVFAALYAAASVFGAMTVMAAYLRSDVRALRGHDTPVLDLRALADAIPGAAQALGRTLIESWQMPAIMAAAVLPAFTLVLARALRLRRTGKHAAAEEPKTSTPEKEPEPEPEYRAPFEPLQPAKGDPTATGSFFLPPDRGEA